MKKKLVIMLVAAMMAAAVFSGCGNKNAQTGSSVSAEAEDVQISAKELLKATDYDVKKYVTLNDYMNMTVELSQTYEASDADIQSYVEQIIASYPGYEKTDKTTVEDGDIVNIDYEGTQDGVAFSGGTAVGAHLEIGSDSFIDGFEDGLIGRNVGETVQLDLTFPEDYSSNPDLAGQAVVFTVTINSIDTELEMTYDTLTDEYVSSNFAGYYGWVTVDDMKSAAADYLNSYNEYYKQQEIQTKILDKLVEECTVEIPEGLLDERITDYKTKTQAKADAAEMELDTYLQNNMGMTEDEFNEQVDVYMEESLIQELILEAIVEDQDISISQNDFSSFVASYVSNYQLESEEALYEEYGGEAYIKLSYAENQALLKLMNNVKTTVAASDSSAEE